MELLYIFNDFNIKLYEREYAFFVEGIHYQDACKIQRLR